MSRILVAAIAVVAACGGPEPATSDGGVADAFRSVPDATPDAASDAESGIPRRERLDECATAFIGGLVGRILSFREGPTSDLVFYDAAAGPDNFVGIYLSTPPLVGGSTHEFAWSPTETTRAPVVMLIGSTCADPDDWRSCETLHLATQGRVYVHEMPEAAGEPAFVEVADVFLETIESFDPVDLSYEWSAGECAYLRTVVFSDDATGTPRPDCEPRDLYCAFGDR